MRGKRGKQQKENKQAGKLNLLEQDAEAALNVQEEEIQLKAKDAELKSMDNEPRARAIYDVIAGKDEITQKQILKSYQERGIVTRGTLIYLNRLLHPKR